MMIDYIVKVEMTVAVYIPFGLAERSGSSEHLFFSGYPLLITSLFNKRADSLADAFYRLYAFNLNQRSRFIGRIKNNRPDAEYLLSE